MNRYRKKGDKWVYHPGLKEPFRLSRSKIDLFLQCPRCFYLDVRLGLKRPSMPAFTLNSAVDELLKREFDILRQKGESHALMKKYGIDAVPFSHPDIDKWRQNFIGKEYLHKPTNLLIFGAVDDLWVNKKGELIIVDYKATSTDKEISLDSEYKRGYKKQMEVYQWIFRKSGFKVSEVGYFIFANGDRTKPRFDGRLEFKLSIISHKGDISWIEPTLFEIKRCLDSDVVPNPNPNCEYCLYQKMTNVG